MANYLIVRKNPHQKGNPKIPYIHFTFSHIVNHACAYSHLFCFRGKYFWKEVKTERHNSCKFYF